MMLTGIAMSWSLFEICSFIFLRLLFGCYFVEFFDIVTFYACIIRLVSIKNRHVTNLNNKI